jgi:hypothetical protein
MALAEQHRVAIALAYQPKELAEDHRLQSRIARVEFVVKMLLQRLFVDRLFGARVQHHLGDVVVVQQSAGEQTNNMPLLISRHETRHASRA